MNLKGSANALNTSRTNTKVDVRKKGEFIEKVEEKCTDGEPMMFITKKNCGKIIEVNAFRK